MTEPKPKAWVITHDGRAAWNWAAPAERIELDDPDRFIVERVAAGDMIASDDRGKPAGNVWN